MEKQAQIHEQERKMMLRNLAVEEKKWVEHSTSFAELSTDFCCFSESKISNLKLLDFELKTKRLRNQL
jgi:hypothetical protein